ncbi:MAG: DUF2793 domain-containing protein [Alphaproteobacteria bacterium]|nr:DUF2793 domain-containing protein [Alphaproteobacteria bacterium]
MTDTPRLGLPLIDGEQALKHITHNEALGRLDAAVQLTLEGIGATTPPGAPVAGEVWALGTGATGEWSGEDGALALYTESGWRFVAPAEGWRAWNKADAALHVHVSGAWVGFAGLIAVLQDLDWLGINTSGDATNRLALRSNAALMTALAAADGGSGDMRLVVNKETAGDTASLIFQTGYSARAEFGLAGVDDFAIKTSADGSNFHAALTVSAASGFVRFNGLVGAEVSFPSIASGVLAVSTSFAVPVPQSGTADDVDSISGGADGALLIVTGTAGNSLTFRDGVGNLKLGGNRVLNAFEDALMLVRRGSDWIELSFANNG